MTNSKGMQRAPSEMEASLIKETGTAPRAKRTARANARRREKGPLKGDGGSRDGGGIQLLE